MEFPQCHDLKKLNHHLDEWLEHLYKFGDGMGPLAIQTLFLKTLPHSLRSEIYKRPELKGMELVKLVDWARYQTVWESSEELASQMTKPERVMPVRRQRDHPQPPQAPGPEGVNAFQQGGARPGAPPAPVGRRPPSRRPTSAGS